MKFKNAEKWNVGDKHGSISDMSASFVVGEEGSEFADLSQSKIYTTLKRLPLGYTQSICENNDGSISVKYDT